MNKAKKEQIFVSYEVASLLKEKGFNDDCLGYFIINDVFTIGHVFHIADINFEKQHYNLLKCPTHQQVLDWLRENHKINISAVAWDSNFSEFFYKIQIGDEVLAPKKLSKTYYEALNLAIEQSLNIVK